MAVAVNTGSGRGQAGEDRRARRIACRHRAIGPGKERATLRETFQVGSLDRVLVVEQRRPVVHVVNGDEQDVRPFAGSTGLGGRFCWLRLVRFPVLLWFCRRGLFTGEPSVITQRWQVAGFGKDGLGVFHEGGGTNVFPEVGDVGVEGCLHGFDPVGVLVRQIVSFTEVGFEVVEFGEPILLHAVAHEFPLALADAVVFVVERPVGRSRAASVEEQVADVPAVDDAIGRDGLSGHSGDGRHDVRGGHDLRGGAARGNLPRPPGNGRDPHVAFILGAELGATQRPAGGLAPASVVVCEEDERVFIEAEFPERLQDAARAVVNLCNQRGHHISLCGFESFGRHHGRRVHRGMRDVGEERLVLVAFDEVDGRIGDRIRDDGLACRVRDVSDGLVLLHPGQRWVLSSGVSLHPHVVGVRDAFVFIEALGERHELRLIAEMPLAETAGGVTRFLQDFRNGDLAGIESSSVRRKDHALAHANPIRITACHERRAGRCARGRTDVKVRELHALFCHPIEMRGWA